jgi:hypothetical protein
MTIVNICRSAGVLIYILLSGCSPFMGVSEAQTRTNIRACDYSEVFVSKLSHASMLAIEFVTHALEVCVEYVYILYSFISIIFVEIDQQPTNVWL